MTRKRPAPDPIGVAVADAVALWTLAGEPHRPISVELPEAAGEVRFTQAKYTGEYWLVAVAGMYERYGYQLVDRVHRLVLQNIPRLHVAGRMTTGTWWRLSYSIMPVEWRRKYQHHELDGRAMVLRDAMEDHSFGGLVLVLFDGTEMRLSLEVARDALAEGVIIPTA